MIMKIMKIMTQNNGLISLKNFSATKKKGIFGKNRKCLKPFGSIQLKSY